MATKKEKAALIALYAAAVEMNHNTSLPHLHPTKQFNRGYEWGLEKALEEIGVSTIERFDIWSAIKFPKLEV